MHAEALVDAGKSVPAALCVPLYAGLPQEDQSAVFDEPPENCRKIVFTTQIAETSVTVDGVASQTPKGLEN